MGLICAMQCEKGRGRVELPQQHHPHGAVLLLRAASSSRMCCAETIAERTQQLRTYPDAWCVPCTQCPWVHTMVV